MEYRAEVLIEAEPGHIWEILADAPSWPHWQSGVKSVMGRVAPGEKLKVVSEVNPGRAFPVKVTELQPGRRMTWQGGMPLGLFKGVRTFDLRPDAGRATRFTMQERFSGPLLGLIGRSIPDLGRASISLHAASSRGPKAAEPGPGSARGDREGL